MDDLWQSLRQRKLVQWAIAYDAFAFAQKKYGIKSQPASASSAASK